MSDWNEPKLDELFQAYRASLPDRDASAGFTPELWRRIDQARRPVYNFGRFARRFVTAAMALCFGMAVLSWTPATSTVYSATYVDALNEEIPEAEFPVGENL